MKISVTQEHIDKGDPSDSMSCPVALAIKDAVGGEVEVASALRPGVGYRLAVLGESGDQVWVSNAVARFVRAFDNGHFVRPFTFILNWD